MGSRLFYLIRTKQAGIDGENWIIRGQQRAYSYSKSGPGTCVCGPQAEPPAGRECHMKGATHIVIRKDEEVRRYFTIQASDTTITVSSLIQFFRHSRGFSVQIYQDFQEKARIPNFLSLM